MSSFGFGTGAFTPHRARCDHERFSHYVDKDKLTEAMVMGTPVIALCGKVWVPSRSPEKFPVCPDCKEVWDSFNDGGSGGSGGSDA